MDAFFRLFLLRTRRNQTSKAQPTAKPTRLVNTGTTIATLECLDPFGFEDEAFVVAAGPFTVRVTIIGPLIFGDKAAADLLTELPEALVIVEGPSMSVDMGSVVPSRSTDEILVAKLRVTTVGTPRALGVLSPKSTLDMAYDSLASTIEKPSIHWFLFAATNTREGSAYRNYCARRCSLLHTRCRSCRGRGNKLDSRHCKPRLCTHRGSWISAQFLFLHQSICRPWGHSSDRHTLTTSNVGDLRPRQIKGALITAQSGSPG